MALGDLARRVLRQVAHQVVGRGAAEARQPLGREAAQLTHVEGLGVSDLNDSGDDLAPVVVAQCLGVVEFVGAGVVDESVEAVGGTPEVAAWSELSAGVASGFWLGDVDALTGRRCGRRSGRADSHRWPELVMHKGFRTWLHAGSAVRAEVSTGSTSGG